MVLLSATPMYTSLMKNHGDKMEKLHKRRKLAIKEAMKQPDNFEAVLSLQGYTVVDKRVLKSLCKIVSRSVGKCM